MTVNTTVDGTTYTDIETIEVGGKSIALVGQAALQEKTATVNGEVTPDSGYDGLSKVTVNVSGGGSTLITKSITENGTYNASSDNADGYSSVTVDVPQGITPTGSQTFTQNGTYDVTNLAQAIVNVSGGGGLPNVETGTYTITATDVTNESFEFELQNAADMILIYPTAQQSQPSSGYDRLIYVVFSKNMVKFLGSGEAVANLGSQVYAITACMSGNGLIYSITQTKTSNDSTGIYNTTVKFKNTLPDYPIVAGNYNYFAIRGITS